MQVGFQQYSKACQVELLNPFKVGHELLLPLAEGYPSFPVPVM